WPHPEFAIVCDLPTEIHRQSPAEAGGGVRRLHHVGGPAIRWADGSALWFLRGVQVGQHVAERPWEITADDIRAEKNAEARRVMIDCFGAARYLRAIGAVEVQRDEAGRLLRADIDDVEPLVMVELINSSPEPIGYRPGEGEAGEWRGARWHKQYILRVPPTMRTAREAKAWTCYTTPDRYKPAIET
ncbi:MAG: DUF6745 domain-containing protein, partial [Vulcanimicrobiaceae bacterium]